MAVVSLVARIEGQAASFEKTFANATRTSQKFEKDFAGVASSVTAQQKRITQAFESFSGDRIARDAAAVARAVDQIGGASKLTAAEQARVNSVVTEAISKYNALGQAAPKSLTDLEQATRKVVAATEDIPKKLSLADKAAGLLSSTFGQFTAANLAANAITGIVTKLGEFVAQGEKLPAISGAFTRLSASVGQSSGDMLDALQKGTRGLVSNLDLMQSSNKAILLGLPVTAQSMGELSEAATKLGRAMGLDAKQSLDDLITALGRSSPLILDNLGLTVKVGEANEEYAKKLGKASSSLTDAEKKMAFYEAAMEAARKKTVELGDSTLTLSERFDRAWVSIGNIVTAGASTLNTGLGRATSSLREFGTFIEDIAKVGLAQATLNASIREEIARSAAAAKKAAEEAGAAQRNYTKEIKDAIATMPALTRAGREQYEAALKLGATQEELTAQFGLSALQQKLLEERTKNTTKAMKDFGATSREMVARIREQEAAHFKNDIALGEQLNALRKWVTEHRVAREVISATIPELESWQERLQRVRSAVDGMVPALGKMNAGLAAQQRVIHDFVEQARAQLDKELAAGLNFGDRLAQTIIGAFQGGGNVGKSIGAFLGNEIGQALGEKLAESMAKKVGEKFAGALGGLLGPLGAVAGGFLGKLFDNIGGPSKDELLGREVVASFEQQLSGMLTATEKLAIGNESWAITATAVRKAYEDAGFSMADAERAVLKLWESSRKGADASRIAVLEIQAVLDIAAQKQRDLEAQQKESSKAQADAISEATAGTRTRISELTSTYNSLFKSIENEAPEKVMGDVEKATRKAMEAIERENATLLSEMVKTSRGIADGFGDLSPAAKEALEEIEKLFRESKIKIPIDFVLPDGITIPGGTVPAMAKGGIVRKPTLALIGESGPEAVVPLGGGAGFSGGFSGGGVADVYLDGDKVGEAVERSMSRKMRRRGLVSAG